MNDFIEEIKKTQEITYIDKEVSTEYEINNIIKKHPHDTLIFNNVKESSFKVIAGICNTRQKIADSINTEVSSITQKIVESTKKPESIKEVKTIQDVYSITKPANLDELPILRHYKKDAGKYITSGVIIAKDPETGETNASIHRMLLKDEKTLGIRIVPRQLYTYYKKAEKMGKPLDITIAIGLDPAILLATTTSIPITSNELEVANTFKNNTLSTVQCELSDIQVPIAQILLEGKILPFEREKEGPFVDLTGTYDVVREEPIIKIERMHFNKDSYYHSIMPAGNEHKLLQGLPQEPRIFGAVQNTLPTVKNVVLTEGGCCWLHAVISIDKQTQGDAKNVLMAALSAHPSLKHCVIVDEDINIFDPSDVEYAIATRVKGDKDIIIIPEVRGSSLDPCAKPDGTTTKIGVDATKSFENIEKFTRV
ncbi:MAG: UbiD family decarboxylase [Methanobacteriaceae archaeon]|nr:UbiD family decarboxylase [Methanobacteriaceae archaeon]